MNKATRKALDRCIGFIKPGDAVSMGAAARSLAAEHRAARTAAIKAEVEKIIADNCMAPYFITRNGCLIAD